MACANGPDSLFGKQYLLPLLDVFSFCCKNSDSFGVKELSELPQEIDVLWVFLVEQGRYGIFKRDFQAPEGIPGHETMAQPTSI
jgi:hypothetical protein